MSITSVITPNTTIPSATEHEDAEPSTENQTECRLASVKSAPIVSCGVAPLDNILTKIKPIDWTPYQTEGRDGKAKPPSERAYILRTAKQILYTADKEKTPIVNHANSVYYYSETQYKPPSEMEHQNFLIEAAVRCGVPPNIAMYQTFIEKLTKQFLINSARHNNKIAEPDTSYINLRNGTLFFDKKGHHFELHSPKRFVRYSLHFDYDPKAVALLWQRHLARSLPNPEKQRYLAMCLALPFYYGGKIEKAPLFYGQRDTGKSTTLDVYKALIGRENFTTETLATLTKSDNQGLFARARLDGKLANIASDISTAINDEGIAKVLLSREEVSARHPYGLRGFEMQNYARLMFAMNELPHQFFTDAALTKRAAIIVFDQQIKPEDIDTCFVEKIVANELPGVLNWILTVGLERLLETNRLDPPQCCEEEMERLRKEVDPLSTWLMEKDYQLGATHWITVKEAHNDFDNFCRRNKNVTPATKTFSKRLRELGYKIDCINHSIGTRLYYSKSIPENQSDYSVDEAGNPLDPNNIPF